MFYVLRTDPAHYGLPSDHIIYGFRTAAAARDYIRYFKRGQETFRRLMEQDGFVSLAVPHPRETVETLPASLVSKIIDAARAARPDRDPSYFNFHETGDSGYVSPCVAAFLC